MRRRKILFITGSRGEYGYIRPILKQIDQDPGFDYEIVATNMHLLPEFGTTVREIERDGFRLTYKPQCTLAGYTPATMAKSLCLFGLSIVDILEEVRPDIILLAGDRGEQLMGAIAGAHLNIAVAHIQAGEVSGNIDGQSRHAIARFAHIHFPSNEDAAERLRRSGEQEFRIFNVGAPQLDDFLTGPVPDRETIYQRYRLNFADPFILVVQHPVTEEYGAAGAQMETTLAAVAGFGLDTVLIYPNSDAGSAAVIEAAEKFSTSKLHAHRSIPREDYAGLLAHAGVLVGNSSSGLLEAPSFALPVVNIGRRQNGRLRAKNVVDCDHDIGSVAAAIRSCLSPEFRRTLKGMQNPYGDGRSSGRIAEILRTIALDEKLLQKEVTY